MIRASSRSPGAQRNGRVECHGMPPTAVPLYDFSEPEQKSPPGSFIAMDRGGHGDAGIEGQQSFQTVQWNTGGFVHQKEIRIGILIQQGIDANPVQMAECL